MTRTDARRARTESLLAGTPWTQIGPGSVIKGDLVLSGHVLVYGRVEGILFTDGDLWIAPEGQIEGGAHAQRITVEGSCRGRLEAIRSIRLLRRSVVQAELAAPLIDIQEGARFFGEEVDPSGRGRIPRAVASRAGSA